MIQLYNFIEGSFDTLQHVIVIDYDLVRFT